MNKLLKSMSLAMLPALLAGCSPKNAEEADTIIEKPEVTVENGMLTPEVLESLGRIGQFTPSPDGSLIAFTLTYESIDLNKGNAEIYTIKPDGTDMRRITKTASSESDIVWIEDGKRLAFIAKSEDTDNRQIFACDPEGEELVQLSNMENGVECFKFSPDLKKIVMASPVKAWEKDSTLFAGLDKTTGRLVNDLMYKHWDEWVTEIPHPFVADFNGKSIENPVDIMKGEPFECPMRPFNGSESFAWSADSKTLVYASRKLKGMDYAFSTDSNLYAYNLESGKTENLTPDNPGYDTDPAYSPDGSQLAWLSMPTAKYESDKKRLMVRDVKSGTVRDLTEAWDYWPESFNWTPDGKAIVFNAYHEGTEGVFRINVADAAITKITGEEYYDYSDATPLADGTILAGRNSMLVPKDIVMIGKDNKVTPVTDINKDIISQLAPVTVEKHMVPTSDGKQMLAWIIMPGNLDKTKQHPGILYCQGGPQQAVSQFWSYRWNFRIMAAHGYVIIAPCRRGTPGFGTEWNRQISGDYGGQNMRDYFAATDYLAEQPYVDGKKIAAIGASYGGFSVYWLAGHNNGRYAALIAHAGIFNIEAQYLETEEMFFADFDLGGPYWDKNNAVAQRTYATSPHRFTNEWTAPILVTVGELDYRILASQGMMAFNAAKMHGLEAEMLVFPDENHWILKPQNAILWQRVFFNFLDKYLKNNTKADKPAADSAK